MGRLEGMVAIVTGSSRGIGKAIALGLAREGANIVVAGVVENKSMPGTIYRTAEEIRAEGGAAIPLKVDVTSEEDTRHMAEEVVKQLGRIDILVNNTAMVYGITRKPFIEISVAECDKLMAVNLKGLFLCCRAYFPK